MWESVAGPSGGWPDTRGDQPAATFEALLAAAREAAPRRPAEPKAGRKARRKKVDIEDLYAAARGIERR